MIDINYKYAQWSTNVNVMGMNWQTYHEGIWFNPAEKTYDEAIEEIKKIISEKVLKDHPHLIAFDRQEDKNKYANNLKDTDKWTTMPTYQGHDVAGITNNIRIEEVETIEPIDTSFNLIEEILKCTNPKVFKTQRFMCKTDGEKAAWNERNKMFFANEWQPIKLKELSK